VEYLVVIFIAIITIGLLANRELARDKKRIRQIMREYSYKTYSPEDTEGNEPEEGSKGKKKRTAIKRCQPHVFFIIRHSRLSGIFFQNETMRREGKKDSRPIPDKTRQEPE